MKSKILFSLLLFGACFGAHLEGVKVTTADERYAQLQRILDVSQGRALTPNAVADLNASQGIGWLLGVYETLGFEGAWKQSNIGICPSEEVVVSTMAHLYVNYMDAHPKSHEWPAINVATLSAIEAYPCPKGTK